MHKGMKIIVFIFAAIGTFCVVNNFMHWKERRSGWHKIKVEDEKSCDESLLSDIKKGDKTLTGETAIQLQNKGILNITFF